LQVKSPDYEKLKLMHGSDFRYIKGK
jgi:hypothetical protein